MARFRSIQSSFTSGELDPLVKARVDIKAYYNGAEKMRNVLALPQGGFRRRPGLRYLATLPNQISRISSGVTATAANGGTAANANDDDTATMVTTTNNISTTNPYVVIKYDLGSAKTVQYADVVGFTLSAGSNTTEWFIQYSTDDVTYTSLGAAVPAGTTARHRRVTGPITARYWRFARIGATDMGSAKATIQEFTLWQNATPAALSDSRIVDFTFSTEQEYVLLFSDRNVSVWKDDVKQCDVRSPYTSAQLDEMSWTQSLDTLLTCYNQIRPQKLQRQGSDSAWQFDNWTLQNIPTYQFEFVTTATGTPSATTGSTTFTASAATFASTDVGKTIRGNGGIATITAYTDSTHVIVQVYTDFADTTAIAAGLWTLEEAVWSTTRGWPTCSTFFQGRLWFGGSYARPQSIWSSRSGNSEDFDSRKSADDYGINATIDTDDVSAIYNVYAGRALTFMTSSSEFYVPISEDTPIVPDNFVIRRSTRSGSEGPGLRCFDVGGALIFLQRGGRALREFLFVFNEQNYQANPLSLLASHLLAGPVDIALRRATSTSEADYLLIVNGDDGTLTVLCTLRTQEITAFTQCSTDGLFKRCGALPTTSMYFVVERTINGSAVRYFEKFDDDLVTDSAITGTGVASSAAVPWLTGETCAVVLDGGFVQSDEVATGGTVTFERDSVSSYEVGLNFPYVDDGQTLRWMVRDMPVEIDLPDGSLIGRKKRIVEATLRLYQTLSLTVNGERVVFQQFGSSLLDQAVSPYTGDKTIGPLLGWDEMGQLTIGDDIPAKATVLGALKKVAV